MAASAFNRFRGALFVGATALFAFMGQAHAIDAAICGNLDKLPAGTELRAGQAMGKVFVQVTRPGAAGRQLEIEYRDELYGAAFGNDGRAAFAFALVEQKAEFTILQSETPPISCTVTASDFDRFDRVVLRWHDPIKLALHAIEPGGKPGGAGDIGPAQPNLAGKAGLGRMDVIATASRPELTSEMSYVVPLDAMPAGGVIDFKVEFLSRGEAPKAPFCGEGDLAAPKFEAIRIRAGFVSRAKITMGRAACGTTIAPERRLMPILD